jgi:hypothetical protein
VEFDPDSRTTHVGALASNWQVVFSGCELKRNHRQCRQGEKIKNGYRKMCAKAILREDHSSSITHAQSAKKTVQATATVERKTAAAELGWA